MSISKKNKDKSSRVKKLKQRASGSSWFNARLRLNIHNTLYKLAKYLVVVLLWGLSIAVALVIALLQDLPDISKLSQVQKKPSITIRTEDGTVLAKYGDIYGHDLQYKELPKYLHDALIATEDRRFYSHHGVDIFAILRAFYANHMAGHIVQGGSTITQQLAKISFLSADKSWKRKIQEMLLAFKIERQYSKQEIMSMYFNRTYFGHGVYGVDGAAHYYFGKDAHDLSIYEAAVLIGMLKAPTSLAPTNDLDRSLLRGKQVLHNMVAMGYLQERAIFYADPPYPIYRGEARGMLRNPYYTDYVLEELYNKLGNLAKDLEVYTTLRPHMQEALEQAIQQTMRQAKTQYNVQQAAAVALGKDGSIVAMMGGTSYRKSQFNRATQALRQPGSTFKFFVYLAALEHDYQLDSIFEDKPITIGRWSPHNISKRYDGPMTLYEAFARSTNVIAVKLSEQVGRGKSIAMAHRLGIESHLLNVPSIALGTSEITLLELTGAYAHILNDGYQLKPFSITKVTDADGKILYQHHIGRVRRVLAAPIVQKMRSLLSGVISDGTGKASMIEGYDIFGKTGTSQEYRDAYFVASLDGGDAITLGIWAGNDNNSPTKNMTGGGVPVSIWRHFMRQSGLIPGYKGAPPSLNAFAILEGEE